MEKAAQQLIAAAKDIPAEQLHAAFYEFCTYLDVDLGLIGDGDIATVFQAALARRNKTYELGCVLLNSKFVAHVTRG